MYWFCMKYMRHLLYNWPNLCHYIPFLFFPNIITIEIDTLWSTIFKAQKFVLIEIRGSMGVFQVWEEEVVKVVTWSQAPRLKICFHAQLMKFFLLMNVKMPTVVGILTFMSRKNSILGLSEHEKC